MVKIKRYRGLSLKYYLVVTAFGVASTFYYFGPILDKLEEKRLAREQQTAMEAIKLTKEQG